MNVGDVVLLAPFRPPQGSLGRFGRRKPLLGAYRKAQMDDGDDDGADDRGQNI